MKGFVECDHFLGQGVGAGKDRGKRIETGIKATGRPPGA